MTSQKIIAAAALAAFVGAGLGQRAHAEENGAAKPAAPAPAAGKVEKKGDHCGGEKCQKSDAEKCDHCGAKKAAHGDNCSSKDGCNHKKKGEKKK